MAFGYVEMVVYLIDAFYTYGSLDALCVCGIDKGKIVVWYRGMSKRYMVELFSDMGNGIVQWIEAEDGCDAFVKAQEMAARHPNVVDFITTECQKEEEFMG